ncbi:MAG: hypothetical protein IE931_05690 [Sphingobacteriales bacterium]|nr:hypothetical protein [Sphingobacteriales bacterium]
MVKIKIKLTGEQCGYVYKLIEDTDVKLIHPAITDLINDLMLEVVEKLHGRSFWVDKKNTINLTPAQGRAFILYFSYINLKHLPYEQNIIRQIVGTINKTLTDAK